MAVFEGLPRTIVQIRIEADNGDPDCEQLVLDLHRMAALFIVERMRSEIVATVAAHYQHLTLMAARRAAAKARCKRRRKDGKDGHNGQVRLQRRPFSQSSASIPNPNPKPQPKP